MLGGKTRNVTVTVITAKRKTKSYREVWKNRGVKSRIQIFFSWGFNGGISSCNNKEEGILHGAGSGMHKIKRLERKE